MRYLVSYSEHQQRTIEVDADTPEDAEAMVMEGRADYEGSSQVDAEIVSVNDVTEIPDGE
jgi:hypothetical protein